MATEEKILTLHPETGKTGRNIMKSKYDMTCDCLLGLFTDYPEISHKDLTRLSKEILSGKLEGNASWYMETVLLDLMARGRIIRICEKPVKLKIIK